MKFFYDNFTESQVCGMFTVGHYISIVVFFLALTLLLLYSKNFSIEKNKKVRFIIAICICATEVIKITLRLIKREHVDAWIPVYYCSLFLFAVWFTFSKNEIVNKMGYAFITMGGVMASILFVFYPSTSLAIKPIWHPGSIHSFLYHLTMCYVGLMALITKEYTPKVKDGLWYFIFVFSACIIGYIINQIVPANCMFLSNAYKLPILDDILKKSHITYMLIVSFAQSLLMYYANYGIYKLTIKIRERN